MRPDVKANSIILHNDSIRIEPAFAKDNVAVGLFSSDLYAPFCGILIQSVIANSSDTFNYDIIVLERGISQRNKQNMLELIASHPNFSIRFVNVADISSLLRVTPRIHFVLEGALKIFLLSDVFSEYDKFIACDSDLVFEHDAAELFYTDVSDIYIAAANDVLLKYYIGKGYMIKGNNKSMYINEYVTDFLHLPNVEDYLNTGVNVFNLKKCREDNKFEELINLLNQKTYWWLEQDALNEALGRNATFLDGRWNVLNGNGLTKDMYEVLGASALEQWEANREDFYIMHFAGDRKPWLDAHAEYAEVFFKYARSTPWYELLLDSIMSGRLAKIQAEPVRVPVQPQLLTGVTIQNAIITEIKLYKCGYTARDLVKPFYHKIFPVGSKRRNLVDWISGKKLPYGSGNGIVLNIAYTSSDAYARFVGTSCISLFDHNRDATQINVYVIDMDISEQNKANLMSIAEEYGRELIFIGGKQKITHLQKTYSLSGFHGNINSYAKIFPQDFLPPLDRVMFIDADTIITGSISELYSIDLRDAIFAGVPDVGVYFFGHEDSLIVEKNDVYYNTGMLLYNMRQIVNKDLKGKILSAIKNYPSSWRLADQSLLNYAISDDDAIRVHFKFNNYIHTVPADLFKQYKTDKKDQWFIEAVNEIEEARKDMRIVHFVRGARMGGRPWLMWNTSYFAGKYVFYWKRSPWRNIPRGSNINETRIWRRGQGDKAVDLPVIGTAYIILWIYLSKYMSRKSWNYYHQVLLKTKAFYKRCFVKKGKR